MNSFQYSYRPHLLSREHTYWLESSAIGWSQGDQEGRIAFRDISEIRLYRLFMPGSIQKNMISRLHLRCIFGKRLILSPAHYRRFRSWEDRSTQYSEFVNRLLGELQRSNPNLRVATSQHWTTRLRLSTKRKAAVLGGYIMLWLFRAIHNRDLDRTTNTVARLMQYVGPRLRGHRVARANLIAAFPKKSRADIDLILHGMWKNFGRVIGEYAFLDRLWDFNPNDAKSARIIIEQETLDRVARMRESNKPVLYFAAHLANWELPGVAAKALGLRCVTVYRPPQFGGIAGQIIDTRARMMGTLIPARSGAAINLKRALDQGLSVNMLVDQHSVGGIDVLFFDRPCKVNATFARFARLLDCTICGSRVVRLPDNRYRCELTEPLLLPRDADGKIDIVGTMQIITWTIEGWVREYPDQWLWMHRRWR